MPIAMCLRGQQKFGGVADRVQMHQGLLEQQDQDQCVGLSSLPTKA